jgi:hypothetical protein
MPPSIFDVSREVYPEAHKTAAMTFFSVGILLRWMMFWSLAHDDRNSTMVGVVGTAGVVKLVKLRRFKVINELCQPYFTNGWRNRVKLVFGGC